MAEPTLQQVFGTNATQTSTTLTITKADLASVGLTANANNTAESLFVALVLFAKNSLTTANQENNPDQSITVTESSFNFESFADRNNTRYVQNTYEVNLQKIYAGSNIIPNDY